ncbi:hypothetical protein DQ226_17355 [Dietzia maris]|uniref:GmrSD restriction endonucleases N-terminal domain-containing protein n=1 Tax=Dietzia maris TaxID=37915 RepID=A0A365P6A7_9ACTN|nr:hypothetical protein DQ226_17355 [Dietzia maris]
MPELTIGRFSKLRSVINLDPPYQREGQVWNENTKSRFIDSIVNGFDVPKLYFEKSKSRPNPSTGMSYRYAVIDGKQRLEAIGDFLDGSLGLPDDFQYFEDATVSAAGMTSWQLKNEYPILYSKFRNFEIPVVVVSTDSGDLIEEMFQRLNASSSLNAAERRNALSGPARDAANALAAHPLLVKCSPIRNARYKYRELGAKFLAVEHQYATKGRLLDTKAETLFALFEATRGPDPVISQEEMQRFEEEAREKLDLMSGTFEENDYLLRSIGTVVVYYLVFRGVATNGLPLRAHLDRFESARRDVAGLSEEMLDGAGDEAQRLMEYNALVQSTNDGGALTRRSEILSGYLRRHDGLEHMGQSSGS